MSEQPPIYHQNPLNAAAGTRMNDSPMMPVSYYQPSAPRLDGMNLTPGAVPLPNSAYYQYLVRPTEPMNYIYRPMAQMPIFCQGVIPRAFPETQLPNQMTNSVEYGQMGFPSQPYPPHLYPPAAHTSQPIPTSTPAQRSITPSAAVVPQIRTTKAREKVPLKIIHPNTGACIDLMSQSTPQDSRTTPTEESPPTMIATTTPHDAVPITEAAPPTKEAAHDAAPVKEVAHDPVSNPSSTIQVPSEEVHSETVVVKDVHVEQQVEEPQEPPQLHAETGDAVVENGSSPDTSMSKKVIDDFIEAESGEDSEESDVEDAAYRRVYPREFLLTCKDSPVARIPLQELATYFADYSRPRKGHRNTNRAAPQRIIRLPTGITVKRVEGAFVPSHLRKKEGNSENDQQKVLSRELNVILNRVSDGNLTETIGDIRKLNISSAEDLQLLAKLVFQKSIRQPKYSKVFSTLCKELKGFEVSGSEPFEVLILHQTQELFRTPLETLISELNAALDAKIAAAKDDAVKRVLEDGRETNIVKKTEAYYGNITFLAELFLCRLVTPRTMAKCLNDLRESSAPEALNSMLILLRTCGQELEQQSKSVVESCFSRLNGHMKSTKLPTHLIYKIQELIDVRERGWKEIDHTHGPPSDAPAKRPDEKVRWSYPQPPVEPKRKPVQTVNPLTPSSLAVPQQSLDSRKLGPAHANWSQGSGLLSRNPSEDKEGHPRTGLPPAHRQPGVSFAQSLRPKEDYESVLKRQLASARSVLTMLKANEDSMFTVFENCKPEERSAILHGVLDSLMDEKPQVRSAAGMMCLQLLNRRLLSPADMVAVCERYLPNCTEDWLMEYPHGWRYLAEIFQHLIQKDQDYFTLLLSMLKILKSEGRGATILAHCLAQSATRLGPECVVAKFHANRLEWSKLGIPAANVEEFVNKHSVTFTLAPNPLEQKLKELNDLASSTSTSLDQFTNFFKQLCKPDLPGGFVRSCAKTLISKSKGLSRQQIDHRVTGLGILVDHNPDRELQVLQALHECSASGTPPDVWQKSLLDKKVLSSDALESWTKSNNSKDSVSGHIPMRNK